MRVASNSSAAHYRNSPTLKYCNSQLLNHFANCFANQEWIKDAKDTRMKQLKTDAEEKDTDDDYVRNVKQRARSYLDVAGNVLRQHSKQVIL